MLEEIRSTLHEVRTDHLPMLFWYSGLDPLTNLASASPGDLGGFATSVSAEHRNIQDATNTTRTADTPGFSCHVQYCGRGHTGGSAGKVVRVQVRALCEVTSGTGEVKFIGPGGSTTISVTATTPTWVGTTSNYVDLDSTQADSVATTARNKIDVHHKAPAGQNIYTLAVCGWMEYV